jgi:hypothetical protein
MITLNLEFPPATRAEIHHAYRTAAKACHPDRFASDPTKLHVAEEKFKAVHAAYQELTAHCIEADRDGEPSPETASSSHPSRRSSQTYAAAPSAPAPSANSPNWFGNASGCYAPPHLPARAEEAIGRHLGPADYPRAIFDLSGNGSFSSFFLLATQGIMLRDVVGNISLLSYPDLGQVELVDRKQQGKLAFWELIEDRLVGLSNKLSLEIFHRDGRQFCSLDSHASESAKTAVFHYLNYQKTQVPVRGY